MRLVDIVPPQILGKGAQKTQTETEANYADHYRSHQENGVDTGSLTVDGLPVFLERTGRLSVIDLRRRLTHAIISRVDIQYQCIAPGMMETTQLDYLRERLRILSAFYGLLQPFDGVTPYLLEIANWDTDKSTSLFNQYMLYCY